MKKGTESILHFCYEIRLRISVTGKLEFLYMRTDSGKYLYYSRKQIRISLQEEEEKENLKQVVRAIAFMHPGERKQLFRILEHNDSEMHSLFSQIWQEVLEEL